MNTAKKFKVALIYNSTKIPNSLACLIKKLKKDEKIDFEYLILIKNYKIFEKNSIKKFFLYLLHFFENKILLKNNYFKKNNESFESNNFFANTINIKNNFSEEEINKMKLLNLDLIINESFETLKNVNTISFSKQGIYSIYSNNQIDRKYFGFWEVYNKKSNTKINIKKYFNFSEEIVFHGNFHTQAFFKLNNAMKFKKSYFFLSKIIKKIANNEDNNITTSKAQKENDQAIPLTNHIIIYLIKIFFRKFLLFFLKKIRWNIGFISRSDIDFNNIKLKKIKNPINSFLADPFIFNHNSKDYIFVEEYEFKKNKGLISVYDITENFPKRVGVVLEEKFHLSFPYIFNFNNKIYMVPESSQNNDIRLYESIDFPTKWKLKKVLINNISAVDTLIFYKDNFWWLLTNTDTAETGDFNSELSIYYSKNEFITDNWTPHKLNPFYVDSTKSRNAGLIYEKEKIYRINQNHKYMHYGKNIIFNEIQVLNENDFKEKICIEKQSTIIKNLNKFSNHHFSQSQKFIVFDYKKLI